MARKCRHCKAELPPVKKCEDPFQRKGFCNVDHMASHGIEKAEKARERKFKEKLRKDKDKIKTLAQRVTDAQAWVNRVVVAEDKDKGCISCDSQEVTDAGHYFHKGSKYRTSPLTLDRRNLNGQCSACNRYKGGGNQHEYRLGYIERYGQGAFDDLCEYKASVDRGEVPSLTHDECREIIADAKARLKEIRRFG